MTIDATNYMKWLIDSRDKNQNCMLDLYKLIEEFGDIIPSSGNFFVAQALASSCFSLWRAAFLSDIENDTKVTLAHTNAFLKQVLSSNMIGFNQDLQNNHFTARYYVVTAQMHLQFIYEKHKDKYVVRDAPNAYDGATMRGYWDFVQAATTIAVQNFGQHLKPIKAAQAENH